MRRALAALPSGLGLLPLLPEEGAVQHLREPWALGNPPLFFVDADARLAVVDRVLVQAVRGYLLQREVLEVVAFGPVALLEEFRAGRRHLMLQVVEVAAAGLEPILEGVERRLRASPRAPECPGGFASSPHHRHVPGQAARDFPRRRVGELRHGRRAPAVELAGQGSEVAYVCIFICISMCIYIYIYNYRYIYIYMYDTRYSYLYLNQYVYIYIYIYTYIHTYIYIYTYIYIHICGPSCAWTCRRSPTSPRSTWARPGPCPGSSGGNLDRYHNYHKNHHYVHYC